MSDGSEANLDDHTVRYVSREPSVAAVDATGMVTGGTAGSALIGAIVTTSDHRLLQDQIPLQVYDPTSVQLPPSSDAFVRGGDYADQNYGSATSITLKEDSNGNYHREGYLAFDLSDVDGEIVGATLNFYGQVNESGDVEVGDDDHRVHVHAADAGWDENSITWNARPETGSHLGSFDIDEQTRWHTVDLSDALAEHDTAHPFSMAVLHDAPVGNRLTLALRSSEAAYGEPYLQLELDPDSVS